VVLEGGTAQLGALFLFGGHGGWRAGLHATKGVGKATLGAGGGPQF